MNLRNVNFNVFVQWVMLKHLILFNLIVMRLHIFIVILIKPLSPENLLYENEKRNSLAKLIYITHGSNTTIHLL